MHEQAAKAIDQPWVSLAEITEESLPRRNTLIAELMNQMLPLLHQYSASGLQPYLKPWNEYDGYKNKKVRIISGKSVKSGIAKGIF